MLAGSGRCLCRGDEGLAGVVGGVGGFRLLAGGVREGGGFGLLVMGVGVVLGFGRFVLDFLFCLSLPAMRNPVNPDVLIIEGTYIPSHCLVIPVSQGF